MTDLELLMQWHLRVLWDRDVEECQASIGLTQIMDELGRIIENEPIAQKLASGKLDSLVGDLSILSYCLGQLDLFLSWSRNYDAYLTDEREDKIMAEAEKAARYWEKIGDACSEVNLLAPSSSGGSEGKKSAAALGTPDGGRFAYPLEKKRTKENLEALRQAEKNLDEFWSAIDRIVQVKCGWQPGSLTWPDFVHARTSSGLLLAEKMYGTQWHFTHVQKGTRIELRQPHGNGKLPCSTVRRIGRRLRGIFGYDDKTFIPK